MAIAVGLACSLYRLLLPKALRIGVCPPGSPEQGTSLPAWRTAEEMPMHLYNRSSNCHCMSDLIRQAPAAPEVLVTQFRTDQKLQANLKGGSS